MRICRRRFSSAISSCSAPPLAKNTWRLSYRLSAEQAIPLILTAFQRNDDSALLYVLICAPRFDYVNQLNGLQIHMLMDEPLARVRVPTTDMPEDRADWPGFLLSTMAKLQKTDEITLRTGSIDDLKVLLQDASDLIQRRIDVLCAISDYLEPAVFIDKVQPTLRHTITAMASYFHPVAAQVPVRAGWLEERLGRTFGLFRASFHPANAWSPARDSGPSWRSTHWPCRSGRKRSPIA